MQPSLPYNPAYDGLRAVAAILVIGSHCRVPGFGAGFFGVDLFFVLSGFLITRLLAGECDARGKIDLPRFYWRRFLRLTPPLLLFLAAYVAIAPIAWPQFGLGEIARDVALSGLYLSDYARPFWDHPRILQHTWSLSAEEHFYLLWPLAVLLILRLDFRRRVAVLFGLYLLASAWRIVELERIGWATTYYRFDTRLSGLIAGALLAAWLPHARRLSEETANAIGVFACAALVPALALGSWEEPESLIWMIGLVELAAAGLLISAAVPGTWVHVLLSASPLVGIGLISYGLYLWHYPAAFYLRAQLEWYQTTPIVLVIAFTAATISYVAIERPLRRYRRSLSRGRPRWRSEPNGEHSLSRAETAVATRTRS